jgi:hypothetical protein
MVYTPGKIANQTRNEHALFPQDGKQFGRLFVSTNSFGWCYDRERETKVSMMEINTHYLARARASS